MRFLQGFFLGAALISWGVPALANDQVNMTFSFGKAGKDAGVYVALEKGYFGEAKIDLSITSGSGAGVAITNVETGNSQFAASDFGNIIADRSRGGSVKSIMLLYDLSPLAVASLKTTVNLRTPKDLEGHSVAAPIGSTIRVQLPALMRINGVDESKVRLVHIPGSAFVQTLFRGEVDVTSAFLNESGVTLQVEAAKAAKELSWLRFRDFGLDVYAVTIITSDRIIAQNPQLVCRMVGALVKGYSFMASHPEEAAAIMLKRNPELPRDVTEGQIRETVALANTPTFGSHSYGFADDAKLRFTVETLTNAEGLPNRPAVGDVHTNEFLPSR
jgi:NitT/TauT family transport system substrate-binding protein